MDPKQQEAPGQDTEGLVETEVVADDSALSPEANRLLTRELQEAIGADHVRLPPEQARAAGSVSGAGHRTLVSELIANRLLVIITFTALIIVGVVVSLATGSWWAVVVAAGFHALGTIIVGSATLRISTEVEHLAPSTAARLVEEGVADPDRALGDLVEQYAPGDDAHGAAEVVSTGHNRVTASPDQDPARSAVEQQTAMTPAGSPVGPSGDGGAPAILPVIAVAGSVVVGIAAAAAIGGIAWLGAAMLVAASLAWLLLVRHMDGQGEERDDASGPSRAPGDAAKGRRTRLLPTIAIVVTAVVAGVILVGAIGGYL
jgi:membrane protein implicated in regulation of membrane protease activity